MKMSDVFDGPVIQDGDTLLADGYGQLADFSGYKKEARYTSHAINNHDALVDALRELVNYYGLRDCDGDDSLLPPEQQAGEIASAMELLEKLDSE